MSKHPAPALAWRAANDVHLLGCDCDLCEPHRPSAPRPMRIATMIGFNALGLLIGWALAVQL